MGKRFILNYQMGIYPDLQGNFISGGDASDFHYKTLLMHQFQLQFQAGRHVMLGINATIASAHPTYYYSATDSASGESIIKNYKTHISTTGKGFFISVYQKASRSNTLAPVGAYARWMIDYYTINYTDPLGYGYGMDSKEVISRSKALSFCLAIGHSQILWDRIYVDNNVNFRVAIPYGTVLSAPAFDYYVSPGSYVAKRYFFGFNIGVGYLF
jgi:hypothetical protein